MEMKKKNKNYGELRRNRISQIIHSSEEKGKKLEMLEIESDKLN